MRTEIKEDKRRLGIRKEWNNIGKATVTLISDDKRHKIEGSLSVSALKDSAKFEPEIQIQVFTSEKPTIELRGSNNNKWCRGEVYINPNTVDDLVIALNEAREYLNNGN